MSFIKDIIPIFKKHQLLFEEKSEGPGDIVTFIFKSDKKIDWKAGQHGLVSIEIGGGKIKGKPFSIASTPEEGKIMISTRISKQPSDFKKALQALKSGDKVSMRGPIGPFHLEDENKPVIFIAGGIGVTPVRSVLLDAILKRSVGKAPVQLLYISRDEEFLYRDEFELLVQKYDFVKIKYVREREELNSELIRLAQNFGNGALYFVSGGAAMVKSVKELLKRGNIKSKNLKSDIFFGVT